MSRSPSARRLGILALAILLPALVLLAREALPASFGERPLLIFFIPPIIAVALVGGPAPGLLATAVSALLALHLVVSPAGGFALVAGHDFTQWALLVASGVLVSLLSGMLHRARLRDRARRRQLEAALEEQRRSRAQAVVSGERLRHLASVVEAVAGVRDVAELMAIIRGALRKLTGADGATLVMRDGECCHYVDEDAIGPLWKGQRFPLESCISGWAMLNAQSVVIEDIYADARIPHAAYRPTFVKSLAMVPIGRERPVGAIGCYWASQHRATDEELELQQAVAKAMAVGLDNLKLYAEMQAARETAEAAAAEVRRQAAAAAEAQAATLAAQHEARLAALNLMEDAVAARGEAESSLAALRQREAFIQSVLDNLPVGVAVNSVEPAVAFRYMNDNFPRFYRSTRERLSAPDAFWEAVYEDADCRRRMRERVLADCAGGDVARMRWDDVPIVRAGEATTYVSTSSVPLPEKGLMISLVWDVTERKAAEEQLRKLSLAIEQGPNSIVITNVVPEIEYVNEAFTRVTGYARDEVIGRNPRLLKSGRTPRETYDALWDALTHGRTWKGEMINRRRDGGEYVEFAIVTPLRQPDGTITHYVSIKEDVTEKKRIGAELDEYRHHLEDLVAQRTTELVEARRQAEAANAAKSAFLANMSHEIRTPMNAIVGLTHLMQRHIEEPAQRERLERIVEATHHLLALINDILDLSKIEAGHLTLEAAEFDLMQVIENVASLVAERAQARGLELLIDVEPALAASPHLIGDATRLRQVLLNYAGNAVKFTESGSVTLRVRAVEEGADDLLLRFEVADTGIGISREGRERLFRAFEQVDPSITRRYGGTGLGLSINRRLAELMGGEVGVDSEPGVGSLFWFTARLLRSREPARRWVSAGLRGRRALQVDGSPAAHAVLHRMLQTLGMQVEDAADLDAALSAVAQADGARTPIDVVLVDWRTAGLMQRRPAEEVRALPLRWKVPHLLAVAPDLPGVRETAAALGFAHVLTKPVTLSSLNDLLARLLCDLPADTAAQAAAHSEAALQQRAQARGGARILVVEDNPINQEVARDLLREAGLAVDLAGDGAQAVAMATATAYDAILMDMQMPVMDGIEATRRIRALPERARTPILAMTANAFAEDRRRCLEAGMDDFITKPFDPEGLFATVLRWLPGGAGPAAEAAAGTGDERLLSGLAGVPGLDVDAGMRSVLGRAGRYVALLRRFLQLHGEDGARLRQLLAAPDVAEARLRAHTLKGVAATVGAVGVQAAAEALEAALRTGAPAAAALAALERDLSALSGALRAILPAAAPAPGDAADADADAALTHLESLLARDDTTANRRFAAAAPLLRDALGDDFAAIEQAIEAYDYATALARLRQRRPALK
ncbi:MAG: response regulator [Rhodocyclaceae bacterium]|nr:response regulator [Rhodocyclaceae bacterium]